MVIFHGREGGEGTVTPPRSIALAGGPARVAVCLHPLDWVCYVLLPGRITSVAQWQESCTIISQLGTLAAPPTH